MAIVNAFPAAINIEEDFEDFVRLPGTGVTYSDGKIISYSGSYTSTEEASYIAQRSIYKKIKLKYCSWISNFQSYYNLETIILPECTFMGNRTFSGCDGLKYADIPKISTIASYGFDNCSKLSFVNAPSCTAIGQSAFRSCGRTGTSLYLNIPNCQDIGFAAFESADGYLTLNGFSKTITTFAFKSSAYNYSTGYSYCKIEGFHAPNISAIGEGAFYRNNYLSECIAENCSSIGAYAFFSCTKLENLEIPNCEYIGAYAFSYVKIPFLNFSKCQTISQYGFGQTHCLGISLFACETIGSSAFLSANRLREIYLSDCNNIYSCAFSDCTLLTSIYLLGNSIITLSAANAFTNTPLTGSSYLNSQYGSIYVKSSLLTQYKTATNWTIVSNRFVGLTDEQIEGILNSKKFLISSVAAFRGLFHFSSNITWEDYINSNEWHLALKYNPNLSNVTQTCFYISNSYVKIGSFRGSQIMGTSTFLTYNSLSVLKTDTLIEDAIYIG